MKRWHMIIFIAAFLVAGIWGWLRVNAHLQEQYELSLDIAEGEQK